MLENVGKHTGPIASGAALLGSACRSLTSQRGTNLGRHLGRWRQDLHHQPPPCSPSLAFPQFGKLEADGLSGIRLVPIAGYSQPASCQAKPPPPSPPPPSPSPPPPVAPTLPNPLIVDARANSFTSATITGAAPPGLTCTQASGLLGCAGRDDWL